jgi:TonB-linked SusC/RagA family outer membrane protein
MMNFKTFTKGTLLKKSITLLLLVLLFGTIDAMAQGLVKGVVKDVAGNTLPGVSVYVKGNPQNGSVTDINGGFSIKASSKAVLVFSYVGMKTQEVNVGGRKTINVIMQDDVALLNEVVVVGYGTAKKQSLTGAVSAMKGDELLTAPSTNVSSMLGGRLPGISSVQTSGEPGDDQASLRIRGSIYSATYIVDGIPRSINDIDPNDVESISVLKDGASAAVYGLQSAGGVIIVTTKKGKVGKTSITYDGSFGWSKNANFPKFMDGPQFAYYYNMAEMMDQLGNGIISSSANYTPLFSQENITAMTNGDPTDGWDNVNYINKVFGTGHNAKHNVTVQGGNESIKFFTSLGYMNQQGNIDNFKYNRYNLRTNLDAQITKSLKMSLGIAGQVGHRSTPGYSSGGTDDSSVDSETGFLSVAHQTIMMHPYLPEKYNGVYTATIQNNSSLYNSPLAAIYESGYKRVKSFDVQTNFALMWDVPFIKGLQLKANGSYDYESSHSKILNTPYDLVGAPSLKKHEGFALVSQQDPRGLSNGINMGEGQYSFTSLVGQLSANYVKAIDKHHFDILGLMEVRQYKDYDFAGYAKNLSFADLAELSLGTATDDPLSGYSSKTRSVGFVYRVKYDYDNKYLAELTGRYDGSYKFSGSVSGKRWGFFPSASVAWRISSEDFMKEFTFLDDMKIRASIGLLGNDNVSSFSYLSTYSFDGQIMKNGNLVNALYTSSIANPDLTWEKTLSYNAGFDFSMWGGKLTMDFDGFYNYTYDMLTYMGGDYPPSMGGYYNTYRNYDRMDVKGFELTVGHRNTINWEKPLKYGISANITFAKNRYLRYPDSPNEVNWRKHVGRSVDANFGWVADGLYKSEDEITNSAWYGTRPNLGDIKYKDIDGDGAITENDKCLIGRSNRPEITYGINLNGSWNGFDCNFQFTGGLKFDVSMTGTYYNGYDDNTVWTQTFKEGANSPLYLVENSYSEANPNGSYPRITTGDLTHGGDNGLASTFWLRNGNYIRLKSAQIGYSLPKSILAKINLQALRFYFEGSNIFTIDNLPKGIDPESPRVNNGYYPQQRTYMCGMTLTF